MTSNCEEFTDRKGLPRFYTFLLAFKVVLGFELLLCGGLGTHYTEGLEFNGPPYYLGAFLSGGAILVSSFFAILVFMRVRNVGVDMGSVYARKQLASMIYPEMAFAIVAVFTCLLGFVFASFGLDEDCDDARCKVLRNTRENRLLAIIIILGLVCTVLAGVATVYVVCCSPVLGGCYLHIGVSRRRPVDIAAHPGYVGGENEAPGVFTTSGTAGRIIETPNVLSNTATVGGVAYPVGGVMYPPPQDDARLRQLEEENRLLRENLELRQQQQPNNDSVPPEENSSVPPPSYEEVVKSTQKAVSGPPIYDNDSPCEPSAPSLNNTIEQ